MMEELIKRIIDMEWKMFQEVENEGGRAFCQDDSRTFYVMRRSQFRAWSEQLLRSYLNDLETADMKDENLVSYKYAYMMKWTVPEQFKKLVTLLPGCSAKKEKMIYEILDIQMKQTKETNSKYPHVAGRGRGSGLNESGSATIDVYAYGELMSYSENTLELYLEYVRKMEQEGILLPELILQNTVSEYGYRSLKEAEEMLARR